MNDKTELGTEATAPKAIWEAPTIEEIDYAQTEAGPGNYGGTDLGIYTG